MQRLSYARLTLSNTHHGHWDRVWGTSSWERESEGEARRAQSQQSRSCTITSTIRTMRGNRDEVTAAQVTGIVPENLSQTSERKVLPRIKLLETRVR
eukprot:1100771-Amphidinium_carterae.3